MEPEFGYARSGGHSLAYAAVGEGPLELVVVPGFVSHLEAAFEQPALAHMMRRLASFARVITFDKLGTGLSDPLDGPRTLEERVDDLLAVLEAAGAGRVALFGVSEGAPMCVLFAASHPERTRALVMYGSYARGLGGTDEYPWAPTREQVDLGLDMMAAEWGQGTMLDLYAPSVASDPDFARWWARYQRVSASPAMARAVVELAAEIDVTDVLPAVKVPTLVLHRRGDLLWPIEAGRYVAEHIPGAKFVELEGMDHWPFVGDTEALTSEIETFLTGARPGPPPNRQLLTVLFTDIVGSTERAAQLGDRRWRALIESHDALVRDELRRYGGREVKTIGDGFLATFDGPARGIECARQIALGARSLGLEVRAGLHTGECEIRGDDIAGMAVNIAARISALAGAGELLVSTTVRDLVVGSGIEFEPRGAHELKGVPGEWSVLAVRA